MRDSLYMVRNCRTGNSNPRRAAQHVRAVGDPFFIGRRRFVAGGKVPPRVLPAVANSLLFCPPTFAVSRRCLLAAMMCLCLLRTPSARAEGFLDELQADPGVTVREMDSGESVSDGWTPVGADALGRFLRDRRSRAGGNAPFAVVESALYTATFTEAGLHSGMLHADVAHRGQGSSFLDWSETDIALHGLMHDGQPTIWGTAPDGRKLIEVGSSGTWTGEWNARAWTRLGRVWAELTLPKALDSRLQLRAPHGRVVTSSVGLVSGPVPDASDPRWDVWTIDLGRRNDARISLSDAASPSQQTLALGQIETLYNARVDGLYFQVDASVSQGPSSLTDVSFRVPPSAQVLSVSFSGSPITFKRPEDNRGHVTVSLTGAATPGGRTALRLQGFQPVDWERPRATLPRIDFANVIEIERKDRLVVETPLVVAALSTSGLLQTGLQQDELGEIWSFLGTAPRSRIVLTLQRPDPKLVIRSRVVADVAASVPAAVAEVSLEGQEGSAFEVGLDWPPDWDVVVLEGSDASSRLSRWEVTDEENARTLHVEFRQPLLPGAKRVLRLRARAGDRWSESGFQLPVPLLRESGRCETTGWLLTVPTKASSLVGETPYANEQVAVAPADLLSHLPGDPRRAGLTTEQWTWSGKSVVGRPWLRLLPSQPQDRSASVAAESPVPQPPAESETAAGQPFPPACTLKLTTTASSAEAAGHVHRAAYLFSRPVSLQQLGVELSEQATLSMFSADGVPVTVLRSDKVVQVPAEVPPCRRLEIIYATAAPKPAVYRASSVSLPRIKAPILQFDWLLELPRAQRLAHTNLPIAASDASSEVRIEERLFGPLHRGIQDPWFAPWSAADWSHTFAEDETAANSFRHVQMVSTSVPDVITFTTWDDERSRLLGWLCLLGSLTVITMARLFQSTFVRRGCVVWLTLLCGASFLVDDAWAILCGGALSGSLLGLLMPRRLVRRRDLLPMLALKTKRRRAAVSQGAVTAGAMLFVLAGSYALTVPVKSAAQTADAAIEVAVRHGEGRSPTFFVRPGVASQIARLRSEQGAFEPLIRSARYQLRNQGSSIEVQAVFDVVRRKSSTVRLLTLPLSNIVFRQDHHCTIDGRETQIIPGLDGNTILLRLPADQAAPGPDPTADDAGPPADGRPSPAGWITHTIEMSFLIRGQSSSSGGDVQFAARIPAIADAVVETEDVAPDLQRWGILEQSAGGSRVFVGAVSELRSLSRAERGKTNGASVFSHLDVSPLGLKGTMQISVAGDSGQNDQILSIDLTPQCVVRSVTGSSVMEWQTQIGADQKQTLAVVLHNREEAAFGSPPVSMDFELPLTLSDANEFRLPLFEVTSAEVMQHDLGISVPAGWRVEAAGDLPFSTDDFDASSWQQSVMPSRSRLAWSGRIVTPAQARWRLVPPPEDWSWRIDETVRIQADRLQWRAQLDSATLPVRIFHETLLLSHDVTLDSVSAVQSGRQRPVRWVRRGDQFSLFFTDEIGGPLTIFLEGSVPLSGDTKTALPQLAPVRRVNSSARLTVVDETGWPVELSGTQGDMLQYQSEPAQAGTLRTLKTFTDKDARPSHVRVVPGPDAAGAKLVTAAARVGGQWELTSYLNVSARKGPLRTVTIELPPNQRLIRLLPDRIEKSSAVNPDGTTRIMLRIPPRFAANFKPVLVTRLQDVTGRPGAFAGPSITSAVEEARWMILPTSLTKGLPSDHAAPARIGDFQELIPAGWTQRLKSGEAAAFALARPEISLAATPRDEVKASIPLAEIAVQTSKPDRQHGELTWWLTTSNLQRLVFELPEPAVLAGVYVDGVPTPLAQTGPGRYSIPLDRPHSVVPVTILWDRRGTGVVRWPQPLSLQVESQLLALVGARALSPGDGSWTPVGPVNAAVSRWERLQNCLQVPGTSFTFDTALLGDLRRWREYASERVRSLPERQRTKFQDRIDQLREQWQILQQKIVVTADVVADGRAEFPGDLFRKLLERTDADGADGDPTFYEGAGSLTQVRITEGSSWGETAWRATAAAIVLALGFVLNFSFQRWPVSEWLAHHAGVSLAALGLLWWFWLSPSLFGFLLAVIGLMIEIVVLVRGRYAHAGAGELSSSSDAHT